jgi:3-deoxy-D-manno-octulosonic-acid transferase
LGCAIIVGPHMHHFVAITHEFLDRKAAIQLHGTRDLVPTVERLLSASGERVALARAARVLVEEKHAVLDAIIAALLPWLGRPRETDTKKVGT